VSPYYHITHITITEGGAKWDSAEAQAMVETLKGGEGRADCVWVDAVNCSLAR
jgi:hypothetical protein